MALHRVARERGADHAFVITSEEGRPAQRIYEAAGFRGTEGADGPIMLGYVRVLQSFDFRVLSPRSCTRGHGGSGRLGPSPEHVRST